VYNYLELRQELSRAGHRFRTQSDTEVVLVAYRAWGPDCVKRFVGMWAFAIWDRARRELFCSRDRFGIKPFYYIHQGDRFYFGSEYKPLKLSPLFSSSLNQQQIGRGLLLELPSYRDESFFECIKVLPERSNLLFKDGRVIVTEYWDIDASRRFRGAFEDKKRAFLELFRESVRLHLRSDVEVGGCLSGGLDSSAIASVIGTDHSAVPFKTFTIYYDGGGSMDERRWVREVLTAYPHLRPRFLSPSEDEIESAFHCVLQAHDTPIIRSSTMSYYFIMQAAAQERMKVMLDGQGSDEYLAGYEPSYSRLIAGQLRAARLLSAWRTLNWDSCRRLGRRSTGSTSLRAAFGDERALYTNRIRSQSARIGLRAPPEFQLSPVRTSPLKRYLYHELLTTSLPAMLHYQDRIAMRVSIENRVPFLDHRLVEFAHSLDDDDLVFMGQTKRILRAALGHLLPQAITARADKVKFSGQSIIPWLRGPLRFLLEQKFDFDGLAILDPQTSRSLVEGFRRGERGNGRFVWQLAVLRRWMEIQ
jgi:asparagine synthase (glutamine-hydrolysing)